MKGAGVRGASGCVVIAVAGQSVRLEPARVAYWEDARSVIVADLHLGKCEALGAMGVPMPAGMLEKQLATLGAVITGSKAARVIVVGDLLHAPAGLTEKMIECVGTWRDSVDAEIVVVPGNHDRKLEDVAARWRMTVTGPRWEEGPFAFEHVPPAGSNAGKFLWCGHLHPAVYLRAGGDSLKLACFHVGPSRAVLPAFSTFTAGGQLPLRAGDRRFAVAEGEVVEV